MKRLSTSIAGWMFLMGLVPAWADEQAELVFVRRVLPMLQEKCLACHGNDPKEFQGGLDLRTRESTVRGGESETPALIPGRPENSPLYLAVTRTSEDWSAMPPKEADQLTEPQIRWLREWIAGGSPWPDAQQIREIMHTHAPKWSVEDGIKVKTSDGLSTAWTNRLYQPDGLWAYQPVQKPPVQELGASAIDQLIAQRMPSGLVVAPVVDARTFIRRATFDLTGLPPTPEEVAVFMSASSRDFDAATAELIDRLLRSPHYGERMAQHWLDVVRYADSSGFANDYERGNAWRYRDYVVRAFNSDKPYDQFVREQIAGDEIDADNPEMVVAAGFLRMGPWELTGMEVAKVARQRFLDDVTNSVGETFLAHSLQCARCHDHKFDPVPTRDYYSIQAVFATTQLAERPAPFLPAENVTGFEERTTLEQRREEYLTTLRQLDAALLEHAVRWFDANGKDRMKWDRAIQQAQTAENKSGRDYVGVFDSARSFLAKQGIAESDYPPKLVGFTPQQFGNERVARKGLERLRWERERYEPMALSVYSGRTPEMKAVNAPLRIPANYLSQGELEETAILTGGDPFARAEMVQPGVLSVVDADATTTIPADISGRRKAFAEWVANEKNPLTTRAIVNRVWMWHFGAPIAGNPNNFGSTGKRPTHPELLDWLAATLVEQEWSLKSMHRLIMQSDAYRRSPEHPDRESLTANDPTGTSYAVFKPRRLSAEELRDAILMATGELNPQLGGIPNRPEINLEVALQPRQVMGTFASAWVPNPLPQQRHRRSLYALKLRGLSDPAMEVFNAPTPDFSCERRDVSTVTPQVFNLFNSRSSYLRSLALAARAAKETQTDESAIFRCYWLTLGRAPRPDEVDLCLKHWREMENMQTRLKPDVFQQPLEVRREAVEENTGERFTFSEQLHSNKNFVPDLQPGDVNARVRALADVCLALLNSNEFSYVY